MAQNASKFHHQIITLPNILSVVRILLIPVIVWFYSFEKQYVLAGCVLILSGITDVVDGFIARRFNMISDLGKILDPVADKLTQGVMMICLFLRYRIIVIPFALLVVKELFMVISGILVIKKTGKVCGADWHGKVATFMLYIMMALHIFWVDITPIISAVSVIMTSVVMAISLILYFCKNINLLKSTGVKR